MLNLLEILFNVVDIVGYNEFLLGKHEKEISLTSREMERIQRKSKKAIV